MKKYAESLTMERRLYASRLAQIVSKIRAQNENPGAQEQQELLQHASELRVKTA